ncbi:MAG: 30S ribosomal protein S2 [Deltaproteobacteria bacterium]|nr:30S ribosomal protein S2 [Deltaproteobacteria bacterium]
MEFNVDIKELLQAGAHFGHQTRRWNPKMRPFIFTNRDGIHIIDLEQTVDQAKRAAKFLWNTIASGKPVLFVGTKRQAQEIIKQEATRAGQFYVNNRWMGGTLTNFKTIKSSIDNLKNLYARREKGEFEKIKKRERLQMERMIQKLENSLGGIKDMTGIPGAVFIVDPNTEDIAKKEALILGIPVIAIIDTNGNPEGIDYPIVSNDDAIRAIQYISSLMADACLEGGKQREILLREQSTKDAERKGAVPSGPARREQKVGGVGKAYTSKKPKEKTEQLSAEELEAFAKAKAEEATEPTK